MGQDKKRMKKIRKKRIKAIRKHVNKHEEKIEEEPGRLDTSKDYWRKEINEKFLEQINDDKNFLDENDSG